MFNDLDQIDWIGLRAEQVPNLIRGLASEDQSIRNESFDRLLDTDIYERPDFAHAVVPYILRILEHCEVNTETELLLELLAALRSYAEGFIGRNLAKESSTAVISDIDNSKALFLRLSKNPLAKETALELIADIENACS
ncbi:MAG: hypothetical protein K8J31_19570 [Anaerolineae bacterium]|nr:hypothetical protein [Anaerolineae bacterium]